MKLAACLGPGKLFAKMQPSEAPGTGNVSELALFLNGLAEEGRAIVSARPLADDDNSALEALRRLDARAREEAGFALPEFSGPAALWGARMLYHFAQFTVCRDTPAERVEQVCSEDFAGPRNTASSWSVDLTMRHLPRIFQLARHVSSGDPLVVQMRRVGGEWPLSSVGMPNLEIAPINSILLHPGLARIYADRVTALNDFSRLEDVRVADLLRADIGFHRELAPAFAERLFAHDRH